MYICIVLLLSEYKRFGYYVIQVWKIVIMGNWIMGFFNNTSTYYSGSECHKYIDRLILNGEDIRIVSPYVDKYYATFLLDNAGRKRIRIISSSMSAEASRILSKNSSMRVFFAVIVVILGVDYLAYVNLKFLMFAIAFLFSAISAYLSFAALNPRKTRIVVRKPERFVHAKLYISESEAIHGSANFTYNGTHSNIEHVEIIKDMERVIKLQKEFEQLWASSKPN